MKKSLALILTLMLLLGTFAGCKDNNVTDEDLQKANSAVNNSDADYETRLENAENFVESFLGYLKTEESLNSSAEAIAEKYEAVNAVSVINNSDNSTYRIYWISGSADLYGTLEKEWTFIQWKNGDDICAKALEEKSGKKARAVLIEGNKIAILGYDNMYNNKSLYVSLFEVSGEDVNDVTPASDLQNEMFIFDTSENDVYISSVLYKNMYFESTNSGFIISDEDDNAMTLTFSGNLSVL